MKWASVIVVAAILACSGDESSTGVPSVEPGGADTLAAYPKQTLKLTISGRSVALRQYGDYVTKLAGDSFEVRQGGYNPVRYPKTAISLDAGGGVRVADSAGLRHIRIQPMLPGAAYSYIRNPGDIWKVLDNETDYWAAQINTTWRRTVEWNYDDSGNAGMSPCDRGPTCGAVREYDAYVWRFTTSHATEWTPGYFRVDMAGATISSFWGENIPQWCGSSAGTGQGWQILEPSPNLGVRGPGWFYFDHPVGTSFDGYMTNTDEANGSWAAVCWRKMGHDVATTHKHDSTGVLGTPGYIRIQTPAGVKVLGGPYSGQITSNPTVAGWCAPDSTLAWLITDQTGGQFGPYSAAQLGPDGGGALRLERKGYKPQCIP